MRRRLTNGLLILMLAAAAAAAQTEPPRQRQRRESPPQHQVARSIDFFAGRWKVDYVGGEFPPLSAGSRSGTVTFARSGTANFVTGQLDGELGGKPLHETHTIGFDPETNAVTVVERRADNTALIGLGQWKSPLAMLVQVSPMQAGGKTYQMRRTISVTSDVAFEVTDEFSVDGGPFKRLGKGHYTKLAQ